MKYSGKYSGPFYGFPLTVSVISDDHYDGYIVEFFFKEGYCPDGDEINVVKDLIKNEFNASDVSILRTRKTIKFRYPMSRLGRMNSDICIGIAATLFNQVVNNINKDIIDEN